MVEASQDHWGGSGRIVNGAKKRAWTCISRKFCLEDTYHFQPEKLRHSWDSKAHFRHTPYI